MPCRLLVLALVLVATVGCDQATKHLARDQLLPAVPVTVVEGWVTLVLVDNPGAFLGLGAGLPAAVRVLLLGGMAAAALVLVGVYLRSLPDVERLSILACSLLVAGGLSNLGDRIFRSGHVTDFVVLRAGPLQTGVFNLADVAITVGLAALLAGRVWQRWRRRASSPTAAHG